MNDTASRPPSVASNHSAASGVSLTRRPRARPRSRTVTGETRGAADPPSPLPYFDKNLVQEPIPIPHTGLAGARDDLTMRPFQRKDGQTSSATPTTQNTDLAAADTTLVEHSVFGKLPTKANLAHKSSLPAIHTRYQPPPSAFSRDPSHIPNVRDSVSTHLSGTSSSLYPLSSPTVSGPESPPSPRSMSEQFDHVRIDTDPMSVQEFDSDDVAYRLRLLVKNSYFLPPAHSKPSPSDFAPTIPKKQPKPSSPAAFLDLFRPKSKPSTPTTDAPAPMLRSTSDSITAQPTRLSAQTPRILSRPASRGRVVVVREKMGDIAVAAKQAEQDLKSKGVRLDQPPPQAANLDDIVDPTDAVDVPLPSSSYPFAVQASALHGLGVLDSLGADVLADRLPPSQSPNQSASFEIDHDWRKILLHQAVERSLDNTPDVSTLLEVSTPTGSTRRRSKSAAPAPNPAHRLGGLFEDHLPERPRPTTPQHHEDLEKSIDSRTSSYVPPRVETPSSPFDPLSPPPRRKFIGALQSSSQTDLVMPSRPTSAASRHTLRRAQSSPMLADCEPLTRRTSPPPLPYSISSSRMPSARTTMSFDTAHDPMDTRTMDHSIYSDDEFLYPDNVLGRNSLALSAVMGRPSLSVSEYSQDSISASPTTSAFQDALNHGPGYPSSSSSLHSRSQVSLERGRDPHPPPFPHQLRDETISPPPRMSSSLAHFSALPPPPRPATQPFPRHFLRPQSIDSTASTEPASPTGVEGDTIHFTEPEPTTPPLPTIALRRSSTHGLSLDIPRANVLSVSSAEPSPTAFFDTLETQHNAMDEESSDEEEGEADLLDEMVRHAATAASLQRPAFPNDGRVRTNSTASAPVPRSPLMKLVNHSMPYVKPPTESLRHVPIGGGPVGNVVGKAPFFTDRKSDTEHAPPSSTYDFYRFAQESNSQLMLPSASSLSVTASDSRASTGEGRPSFSGTFSSVGSSSKVQSEDVKKLDGMLLQHMEAEKDTIKRIATTMKQTGPPPSAWDEPRSLAASTSSQPRRSPAGSLKEPAVEATT